MEMAFMESCTPKLLPDYDYKKSLLHAAHCLTQRRQRACRGLLDEATISTGSHAIRRENSEKCSSIFGLEAGAETVEGQNHGPPVADQTANIDRKSIFRAVPSDAPGIGLLQ
jgi:hypothetical protein